MAKDIGDLIVKLSLDSAQFESGMEKLEKQMTKLQSQYRSSATGVTDFDKVVTKLEGSAKTVAQVMLVILQDSLVSHQQI